MGESNLIPRGGEIISVNSEQLTVKGSDGRYGRYGRDISDFGLQIADLRNKIAH